MCACVRPSLKTNTPPYIELANTAARSRPWKPTSFYRRKSQPIHSDRRPFTGRDIGQGTPGEITISQAEVTYTLADCVAQIVQVVRSALENTAPELAADIYEGGIIMTGGG
jgi:actin-like ATPase involved in cell morphogenesis